MTTRIVFVKDLETFRYEVPIPNTVRINLTQSIKSASAVGENLTVNLDLQGVNFNNEIVWLHRSTQAMMINGTYASPKVEQFIKLYPQALEALRAYLQNMGYTVVDSQFGTPSDITSLGGSFDKAFEFIKDPDTEKWKLQDYSVREDPK